MYGEEFVKDIPKKLNNDTRIVRRKSYWVPFGYAKIPENSNYLIPVPKELKAIELMVQYRDSGEYSWTELAAWMHKVTGRKISHMGVKTIYTREKEIENGTKKADYKYKSIPKSNKSNLRAKEKETNGVTSRVTPESESESTPSQSTEDTCSTS